MKFAYSIRLWPTPWWVGVRLPINTPRAVGRERWTFRSLGISFGSIRRKGQIIIGVQASFRDERWGPT